MRRLGWSWIAASLLVACGSSTHAADPAPEDAVCCRGTPEQLIQATRDRIYRAEGTLETAQKNFRECETKATAARTACLPSAQSTYDNCMIDVDREVRAFCQTFTDRQSACNAMANAGAKQTCLDELTRKYGVSSGIDCRKKFVNYNIIFDRAYDGPNRCEAARDQACPPVATACHAERVALNKAIAQLSEYKVGLVKIERAAHATPNACVELNSLELPTDRLCDAGEDASYFCLSGNVECVFSQCTKRRAANEAQPGTPPKLRINIGGQSIKSSGLQGTTGNYYTDYTVEYHTTINGAEIKWTEPIRVPGSRSWYGYYYNGCNEVPLREYCAAPNKREYIKSLPKPSKCGQ